MFAERTPAVNRRAAQGGVVQYTTKFGSLANYQKGTVEIIDDDAAHYVFSNMFEVAVDGRGRTRRSPSARTWSTCSR